MVGMRRQKWFGHVAGCLLLVVMGVQGWFGVPLVWAADTGRMVQKNGEWVYVEDLDPALRLLLERALKQVTITQ
jgi:hypothetical protein